MRNLPNFTNSKKPQKRDEAAFLIFTQAKRDVFDCAVFCYRCRQTHRNLNVVTAIYGTKIYFKKHTDFYICKSMKLLVFKSRHKTPSNKIEKH